MGEKGRLEVGGPGNAEVGAGPPELDWGGEERIGFPEEKRPRGEETRRFWKPTSYWTVFPAGLALIQIEKYDF